jgi:hypothetical protein
MDNNQSNNTNNTTGSMVPCYKGDSYYARGPLKDLHADYRKREMYGKIKVKVSGEWIDTFFYFDSKYIYWEEKNE